MKRLTTLFLVLLLAGQAWGATVYTKGIEGTVYYDPGAASCDEVTAEDTSGDLEAAASAAGASGTVYICAATYATTMLDSDGSISMPASGITLQGVGVTRPILDAAGAANQAILVAAGKHDISLISLDVRNGDGVTEDYAAREALIAEIVARMGDGARQ